MGGGGGQVLVGCQGGCKRERRIVGCGGGVRVDVNGELKLLWKLKKHWGGVGSGVGLGGQGGCERRIEVVVGIQKKGVRVGEVSGWM